LIILSFTVKTPGVVSAATLNANELSMIVDHRHGADPPLQKYSCDLPYRGEDDPTVITGDTMTSRTFIAVLPW
jgi:hypothetical protein